MNSYSTEKWNEKHNYQSKEKWRKEEKKAYTQPFLIIAVKNWKLSERTQNGSLLKTKGGWELGGGGREQTEMPRENHSKPWAHPAELHTWGKCCHSPCWHVPCWLHWLWHSRSSEESGGVSVPSVTSHSVTLRSSRLTHCSTKLDSASAAYSTLSEICTMKQVFDSFPVFHPRHFWTDKSIQTSKQCVCVQIM